VLNGHLYSVGAIQCTKSSYYTQLTTITYRVTYQCPSDILFTSCW